MDKITELKAQAYDIISNIEYLQAKLREVNIKISEETKKKSDGQPVVDNNN